MWGDNETAMMVDRTPPVNLDPLPAAPADELVSKPSVQHVSFALNDRVGALRVGDPSSCRSSSPGSPRQKNWKCSVNPCPAYPCSSKCPLPSKSDYPANHPARSSVVQVHGTLQCCWNDEATEERAGSVTEVKEKDVLYPGSQISCYDPQKNSFVPIDCVQRGKCGPLFCVFHPATKNCLSSTKTNMYKTCRALNDRGEEIVQFVRVGQSTLEDRVYSGTDFLEDQSSETVVGVFDPGVHQRCRSGGQFFSSQSSRDPMQGSDQRTSMFHWLAQGLASNYANQRVADRPVPNRGGVFRCSTVMDQEEERLEPMAYIHPVPPPHRRPDHPVARRRLMRTERPRHRPSNPSLCTPPPRCVHVMRQEDTVPWSCEPGRTRYRSRKNWEADCSPVFDLRRSSGSQMEQNKRKPLRRSSLTMQEKAQMYDELMKLIPDVVDPLEEEQNAKVVNRILKKYDDETKEVAPFEEEPERSGSDIPTTDLFEIEEVQYQCAGK